MIKFLKFVPVQLTFFLTFGILVGHFFSIKPSVLIVINAVLFIILSIVFVISFILHKQHFIFRILAYFVSILVGVTSITLNTQINKKLHYSNFTSFNNYNAKTSTLYFREVLKPSKNYNKFKAKVINFEGNKSIGNVIVSIKKDSIVNTLEVDDVILINGIFNQINSPLNPHAFDYKKYLANNQIHHQVFISKNKFIHLPNKISSIKGWAAEFREKINKSLVKYGFKENELAVVNALLLGQRQLISEDLINSYADAGAIHILAVSGLHVGIILIILTFFFKPFHKFKNGKLISSILIVILLWLFAIIAGLSPSVVRAVTMFTALSIGMHLNKPTNTYNTLVISMFFLLLINPNFLFEVGFQLSYLAVFSIIWIQPKIYNLIIPKFWIVRKAWQLLTVSFAAQLGVLPLSIFYFHQFPGLFFISNLVIIPFLGFILTYGVFLIALALFNALPQFLADIFIYIIKLMNGFVSWVGSQRFFILEDIGISFLFMLLTYGLIVSFFKWTENKVFYRLFVFLIIMIAIQSALIIEKRQIESTNEFILFNENRTSLIANRKGKQLTVYSAYDSINKLYSFNPYLLNTGLIKSFKVEETKNLFKFNNESILIVDSLGIYKFKSIKPTIIILQNSPKINLERLIKLHKPKLVVADASNYKYYINKWDNTCTKKKTPFYNTMQKGAFFIKY